MCSDPLFHTDIIIDLLDCTYVSYHADDIQTLLHFKTARPLQSESVRNISGIVLFSRTQKFSIGEVIVS